ncbi:putative efflux protein, MATE family [Mesobacillus persicus]|uniref:Putative efflux protein, MATE family n=1 Tax=Mesobacillus persicus TaxID=930146 RepID=A0A1H7W383_9BACI|nr:MATE family efflux transporter [Mesobacillus persicus]SEM15996.1 putative efflux protein, MATE family [Mesobacillus persicus]
MAQYDFTKGPLVKQLFLFSTPIMLANLLQVSYQFIDSLWVGNLLGANALGAITIASTVVVTVLSFIIGINHATLTILSQQRGKGNDHGLKSYLNAFVVVLATLSLFAGVSGFLFSERILVLLDTPPEMLADANAYLRINFIGILFLLGYNFISSVLRSLGDSKTPLKFVMAAVLLNTVLDPLFISVFGWGMEGAAYATVISQGLSFLYGLIYTLRRKLVPFTLPSLPSKEEVWLILKLGIPSGLQMMVIHAGVLAILSVVNTFGEEVVAGFGASQRIDSLITLPAMALGTAVNSMAGQNIGANRWDRVRQLAIYGALYNLAIMLVMAVVIVLLAESLIGLFIPEGEAATFGTDYLKIIAFFYPFIGLNFILNGIVRGSGAMYQVLVLNVISFWVLRYPLTDLFSSLFGPNGIAFGMGISFVLSSIFSFGYFKFGKWKKQDLFSKGQKISN